MAKVRQNDRLPPLRAVGFTDAGLVDFTQFTSITFKMVGPTTVTGAATGDALGNLTYNWGATDLAVAGLYAGCFIGTAASGKLETFPTGSNIPIEVIPAL